MNRYSDATTRAHGFLRHFRRDESGLALLEFAFGLPILLTMCLTGAELTHYVTTRMRVSQIALQIADNAARMGNGPQLAAKSITENDINDLFIGGQLESRELDLQTNGRVVLSDLEPVANPNTNNRYKIVWQRCYGQKAHPSAYGNTGDTNLQGIGPTDQLATAQDDNATMFVEVYYVYTPIISFSRSPSTTMSEVASMAVRDRRNLTEGITNAENAPVANCGS